LTEGYEIFPTHHRTEKHTSSGIKYRLIWSQSILREGQRWLYEPDQKPLV
jgi:hypothetical protein